jgi:molybdate-binding protein/DNA-binding XRE family transcriptional regulator
MAPVKNTLREVRARAGLSQDEAAEQAGVSRQAYRAIEAGKAVPSTEVALRLARALGTTVEALFSLEDGPTVEAEVVEEAHASAGQRVQVVEVGGHLLARPVTGQAGTLHTLARADGVVAQAGEFGRRATVRLFHAEPRKTPTVVMAGCDPAVTLLAAAMQERGTRLVWTEMASLAALGALARGEAHVAGCHVADPATGVYNAPWVERLVPFRCTLVRFATWKQGLITGAGNPHRLRNMEDVVNAKLVIVNRQGGSGSRLLLDRLLQRLHVDTWSVRGYRQEVSGHLAVAEVVGAGLAQVGVGAEVAARVAGLHFVPLAEERYDLVIPNKFLNEPGVVALLDTLRLAGLRNEIEALGGYDAAEMGRV